jgi:rhotekin
VEKLQHKIDHEMKMRDGTAKLLAACRRSSQAVEVAKNLLVSNARVNAYMEEMRRLEAYEARLEFQYL